MTSHVIEWAVNSLELFYSSLIKLLQPFIVDERQAGEAVKKPEAARLQPGFEGDTVNSHRWFHYRSPECGH